MGDYEAVAGLGYGAEDRWHDKYGNKRTYGYGRFTGNKYKNKGHGKLKVSQCKGECTRSDFEIPALRKSDGERYKVYTVKHKAQGLAKCTQCSYISAIPLWKGARCPCCGRVFSYTPRGIVRNSKHYIEPKRID
jgi:hypothetical protein